MSGFYLNVGEADNKFAAFMAASTRNAANKMNHSATNIRIAQSLARMLEQCVDCDAVYVNYTKKMVNVKVQNFRKATDKKLYNEIYADCVAKGFEIGGTVAASQIFRLYK